MKFVQSYRWLLLGTLLAFCSVSGSRVFGEPPKPAQQTILFGAAYYEEYSPTDRLEEDVRMMKETGVTVVR
jgi:beta-galactosidase